MTSGSRTLKDATNEALRDWVANVEDTFYIIGSVVGPHPYPAMVRDFQTVIGNETRAQMLAREKQAARSGGGLRRRRLQRHRHVPSLSRRCRRGNSRRRSGGRGRGHAIAMPPPSPRARPACCMARVPICCRISDGQILEAHSISAGLDYPGVGPEHAWLKDIGRVKYFSVTDREALDAFMLLSKLEGIIPALESAHALAHVAQDRAADDARTRSIAVCLSGRGDKDVFSVAEALGEKI